jgi:hypothetical protein
MMPSPERDFMSTNPASEKSITQPSPDGTNTLTTSKSRVIKVRFHDGEEHVIDLTPTAEDDRIREFMAMNRPGEIDTQTGKITLYEDEIDATRRALEKFISISVAKGKEKVAASTTPRQVDRRSKPKPKLAGI